SLTRAQSTSFLKAGWSRKWRRAQSYPVSIPPTKKTRNATSSGRRRVDVLRAFEDACLFSASFQYFDRARTPRHHPDDDAAKAHGRVPGGGEHCSARDCRMVADGKPPHAYIGKPVSTVESNPGAGRNCRAGGRHQLAAVA